MNHDPIILTTAEGPVFLITMNRPPMNAIHPQTLVELESAVKEFIASPVHKVAIIHGGDSPVFSAGADIFEFNDLVESGKVLDFVAHGQTLFQRIYESPKPFIAAVNGLAVGGGLELMLACHFRILAERAKVGLPEVDLGILPGWGGTQRLPRMVGQAKALEMILTGESISAQEALRLNLANKVVPRGEVLPAALELAGKIVQKSDLSVRAILEAVRASGQVHLTEGLVFEANLLAGLMDSEKVRETLRVLAEKSQKRRS